MSWFYNITEFQRIIPNILELWFTRSDLVRIDPAEISTLLIYRKPTFSWFCSGWAHFFFNEKMKKKVL